VSDIELVAGVIAAFFAFGIVAGVLAVIALSALRSHRNRGGRRRGSGEYDPNQTQPADWTRTAVPRQPSAPDWEDRPGWSKPPGFDESGDIRPPWPGRRG
jgi:hypothetical protein